MQRLGGNDNARNSNALKASGNLYFARPAKVAARIFELKPNGAISFGPQFSHLSDPSNKVLDNQLLSSTFCDSSGTTKSASKGAFFI